MELPKRRYSDEHRENILKYREAGGDGNSLGIILSDKEKDLDKRWNFAADKIREQKYKRRRIVQLIMNEFGVSHDTACRDMVNAEYVYAASYPLNKPFTIQTRIEFLIEKINEAYIDKDYKCAAMLERELRQYIEIYPEFQPTRRPQQVLMILQQNIHVTNITHEEAFRDADQVLKELEDYGDTRK